jgi:hypothetical protein
MRPHKTPGRKLRMSIKSKVLAAAATLITACGAAPGAASAATPECAAVAVCISVFSSELGTYDQPNFVEAVLGGGGANIGQPVGLKRASRFDPSEDILPGAPVPRATVADFYAVGMVSAEANRHYGSLAAVQQNYAPFGIATDLCVGLASVAQNEGLTLQPCSVPGTTVWVVHQGLATTAGYFPIINAATTDFSRPFAMHLPRNEVASGRPLQMQARRLQFLTREKTLRARQLWGAVFGELK